MYQMQECHPLQKVKHIYKYVFRVLLVKIPLPFLFYFKMSKKRKI